MSFRSAFQSFCWLAVATITTAARRPPNIVLLFVDDLGYGDVGFTGHPTTRTPNLDRMASLGKRLTSWYTGYPVCTASRTSLLTGRLAPRVGMPGVINSLAVEGLPLNETTIADHMRAGGYKTLAIGKWHQGQRPEYLPRERGFDRFLGLPFSVDDGEGFAPNCAPRASSPATSFEEPPRPDLAGIPTKLKLGPELPLPSIRQDSTSSVIVQQPTNLLPLNEQWWNETAKFLRDFADQPMFAYIAFGHVHTTTPNIYPEVGLQQYAGCAFQGSTRRGPFGDALAEVDWFAGMLKAELERLDLDKDTLVIFTSDNGPSLRWGLGAGSMGQFIGAAATFKNGTSYTNTGKGSTWEGGLRMPAFAYWPGTVEPHTSSAEVVSTLDILPSVLKIAGLPPPPNTIVIDGRDSLADIIIGGPDARSKHTFLPFYNGYYGNVSSGLYAARAGRYKVHWITSPGLGGGRWPYPAHPTDAAHDVERWHHDIPLVFDIEADPSEMFPVSPSRLPPTLLSDLGKQKREFEAGLAPAQIDPRFGFEWALCCGVGCQAPCDACQCENVALPLPGERNIF